MNTRAVWVLFFFVLIAIGGGLWWSRSGREPSAAAGLDGLAGIAPHDAQFFAAVDVRDRLDFATALVALAQLETQQPQMKTEREKIEKKLGVSLQEISKWATTALYMAMLPREGQTSLVPASGQEPPLFVAAMPVADAALARDGLARLFAAGGEPAREIDEGGMHVWLFGESGKEVAFGLHGKVLMFGSTQAALYRAAAAASGRAQTLLSQPLYREAREKVAASNGFIGFVSLYAALSGLKERTDVKDFADAVTMKGLEGLPYFIIGTVGSGTAMQTQAFLKVDPKSQQLLPKALLKAQGIDLDVARYFPVKRAIYSEYDLAWVYEVLFEVVRLFPKIRVQAGMLPVGLQMQFGLNLQKDLLGNISEVAASSDILEQMPALVARQQTQPTSIFVLGLRDEKAARDVIAKLESALGQPSRTLRQQSDVQVRGYARTGYAVQWVLTLQPRPTWILAIGPKAGEWLDESIRAGLAPSGSIASMPGYKALAQAGTGPAVAASFVDFGSVLRQGISLIRSAVADASADEKAWLEMVLSRIDPNADLKSYTVMRVEPDGIRQIDTGVSYVTVAAASGIAAAILVPNFIRARAQGQATACRSNMKNFSVALEVYSQESAGQYPPALGGLTPNYMITMPTCPSAGQDTYTEGYAVSTAPAAYTVVCSRQNHLGVGMQPNYPQYTSTEGPRQ